MLFNSSEFIIFFAAVLVLNGLLRRHYRLQNLMLLAASYVFYGAWDWRFLGLIATITSVNYFAALGIGRARTVVGRKACLTVSLAVSLGVLGVFKYLDFGLDSVTALLAAFHLKAHIPTLRLILPVGISFYTFQAISYAVDVYRREEQPVRNLLDFALYVAFFPQLVAGPIEKSTDLLPQFRAPRRVTRQDVKAGLLLVLLGYFEKIAMADTLAPFVNHAFEYPDKVSGIISAASILAFAVQIYGDFAGYTLIARGVALLLGIRLVRNFNRPYIAVSPRDFWRRWHISLSNWLKIYLYFPLGGNRKGNARTAVNLMLTMLLGGLWHGAAWNFVLWGGYHGLLLVLCRATASSTQAPAGGRRVLQTVGTFLLVLFGWLLFRADSVANIGAILANIFTNWHMTDSLPYYLRPTLSLFALLICYHVWQERTGDEFVLLRASPWVQGGVYLFIVFCLFAVDSKPVPFVYFQF